MAKQNMVPVKEWHNMNQCQEIAKEWKAFVSAKDALVKAIRENYGEDAPISFQRYSFGEPENAKPAKATATTVTPELMAQFAAFLAANGAKVSKASKAK